MRARTPVTAALLLALMLAVKLALVLSLADVFFYGEELEKGTAAKAMLDGLPVPHHTLAYHYYEGGGFTVSHLTALAFGLVGQNVLAHKLVALGFNAVILLVGFAFVRRVFGLAAAGVFGLLFTFAPPGIQKISLLNLGIHYESMLFLLALFLFGTRLLFEGEPRRRTVFAFGLIAGFGAFFSYQTVPVTLYLVALIVLRRREAVAGGRELAFGWGALLGAAPLLAMWHAVGNEVFVIHGTPLVGGEQEEGTGGLAGVGTFLYTLLAGGGPLEHLRFAVALVLPFVGLVLFARRRSPGSEVARGAYFLLFGYAAVYSVLYVTSPFVVDVALHHFSLQRTTPFWMTGIVFAAASIGALLGSPRGNVRVRGALCLLALLGHGVQGTVEAIAEGRPGRIAENARLLLDAKGYTYSEYFAKFFKHLPEGHEERLAVALHFDEPDRDWLRAEIAAALYARSDLGPEEIVDTFKRLDPDGWKDYLPGLGPYFFHRGSNNMKTALRLVAGGPEPHRSRFFEALGRRGLHLRTLPAALALELVDLEGSELPPAYYRGFGHRVYVGFRLDPDGVPGFLATVPDAYREMVARGYEVARKQRTFAGDAEASPDDTAAEEAGDG